VAAATATGAVINVRGINQRSTLHLLRARRSQRPDCRRHLTRPTREIEIGSAPRDQSFDRQPAPLLVAELLLDLLAQFGPGNQLGRPSCERVAQILVIAGFFLALAPSSVALWKLARQR
jgi:hypothetical protein